MVIWLRGDTGPLGVGGDVVRREDVAQLLALDAAAQALDARGAALLVEAEQRAAAIVAAAEARAAAIEADAERRTAGSTRLGYAAGHRQGLADAHARMQAGARDGRAALQSMRERLAAIVFAAARKLLTDAPRESLFRRAADLVGAELEQASFLTVTVHPDDAAHVHQVFAGTAWAVRPAIVEDAALAPGSCVCEWDDGVLDAGLPAQLAALRQSLDRALETAP
jgi:type III secretion protein L